MELHAGPGHSTRGALADFSDWLTADWLTCACVQVKGNYGVPYDLQVTTLQALTLLVFNRRAINVRARPYLSLVQLSLILAADCRLDLRRSAQR